MPCYWSGWNVSHIHLNPVRVKAAKSLPVEERRRVLAEFRWSSYPALAAKSRSVLRSDSFLEWIRREFVLRRKGDLTEIPEARRGRGSFSLDTVIAAVAAVAGVPAHVLRTRRCRNRTARDLLMTASRRYCRGTVPQSVMARTLGLTLGGFLAASERGERLDGSLSLAEVDNALVLGK